MTSSMWITCHWYHHRISIVLVYVNIVQPYFGRLSGSEVVQSICAFQQINVIPTVHKEYSYNCSFIFWYIVEILRCLSSLSSEHVSFTKVIQSTSSWKTVTRIVVLENKKCAALFIYGSLKNTRQYPCGNSHMHLGTEGGVKFSPIDARRYMYMLKKL